MADAPSERDGNGLGPSVLHPPYARRECIACHDYDDSRRLRNDFLDTCADCHEQYFSEEVGHVPVREKLCLKCHEPHAGRHPGLLRRSVARTCGRCHVKAGLLSPEHHTRDDTHDCTVCHDPHFGVGFRLKPDAPIDHTRYNARSGADRTTPKDHLIIPRR